MAKETGHTHYAFKESCMKIPVRLGGGEKREGERQGEDACTMYIATSLKVVKTAITLSFRNVIMCDRIASLAVKW